MAVAAGLIGGTGLVGSHILSTLLTLPNISTIGLFSRRQPNIPQNCKLETTIVADSSQWAAKFPSLLKGGTVPQIFFSALGTTRAQAGSLENHRKIDIDLNLALANAAKDAGVKVYVLISSANPSTSARWSAYSRMKGELEEAIEKLDFECTVLVRPGLILGKREESRPAQAVVGGIARFVGSISHGALMDSWAQEAEVIARAASREVIAGRDCSFGQSGMGIVTATGEYFMPVAKRRMNLVNLKAVNDGLPERLYTFLVALVKRRSYKS